MKCHQYVLKNSNTFIQWLQNDWLVDKGEKGSFDECIRSSKTRNFQSINVSKYGDHLAYHVIW